MKKRAILKTITSNFFIDGKNAVISIRKPFEICLQRVSCPTWLRNINFGRVREVLDLLELGKNVSNLMQRLRTENVSPQQNSGENSQNDTNADNLLN